MTNAQSDTPHKAFGSPMTGDTAHYYRAFPPSYHSESRSENLSKKILIWKEIILQLLLRAERFEEPINHRHYEQQEEKQAIISSQLW